MLLTWLLWVNPLGTTQLPPWTEQNIFHITLIDLNAVIWADFLCQVRWWTRPHAPVSCWQHGTAARKCQTSPQWPGWVSRCGPFGWTWSASDVSGWGRSWLWWLHKAEWILPLSPRHTEASPAHRRIKNKTMLFCSWWVFKCSDIFHLLVIFLLVIQENDWTIKIIVSHRLLTCWGKVWLGAHTSIVLFISSLFTLMSRNTSDGIEIIITSSHVPAISLITIFLLAREDTFVGITTATSLCTLISVIIKTEAYMLQLHR